MNSLKNSRIIITGGAGLVGSHTCDMLINEGPKEIIVIDDFSRGKKENLEQAFKSGIVKIIEGDIRDRRLISTAFKDIDYCFHLAAIRITECAQDPEKCIQIMVNGTFDILKSCVNERIKKIVVASSASIYGMADEFPTPESHHPYNNRTLYGAAKIFNEQLLRAFNSMYGLNYLALRYFNVYGPRMDMKGKYTEVLVRWLDCIDRCQSPKIHGDGKTSMDFIFIKDVARANILAMKSDATDMVFNIASGEETSLKELLRKLLKLKNSSFSPEYERERKVNPVKRRIALTKLAKKHLKFKPQYTLENGLKELIEWRNSLSR